MKEIIEEGSVSSKKSQNEESLDGDTFNQESFERFDTESKLDLDNDHVLNKEELKEDQLQIPTLIEDDPQNNSLIIKADKAKLLKRKKADKNEVSVKMEEKLNLTSLDFLSEDKQSEG